MSPKLDEPRRGEPKRAEPRGPEGGPLEAAVRGSVLSGLGRPPGPHRVQVRRVWGDRYRVNVLVGRDAASTTIAHSYFLVVDEAGNIETTSPAIRRQYDP